MSKFCGNCGDEVPEGDHFCSSCGKPVSREEAQGSPSNVTTRQPSADDPSHVGMAPPPRVASPDLPPPPQPEPPPLNVPPPTQQPAGGGRSRRGLILGAGCATVLGVGAMLVVLVFLVAMCGGGGGGGGGGASGTLEPPTEAEIQQTIEKSFTEVYSNQVGAPAYEDVQVSFAFGPAEVGDLTEHQMDYDEPVPAYPIRIPVEVTTTYTFEDGTTSSDTAYRGSHPENESAGSDVFWFYVDEFDEWNFRTGSP